MGYSGIGVFCKVVYGFGLGRYIVIFSILGGVKRVLMKVVGWYVVF